MSFARSICHGKIPAEWQPHGQQCHQYSAPNLHRVGAGESGCCDSGARRNKLGVTTVAPECAGMLYVPYQPGPLRTTNPPKEKDHCEKPPMLTSWGGWESAPCPHWLCMGCTSSILAAENTAMHAVVTYQCQITPVLEGPPQPILYNVPHLWKMLSIGL